MAKSGLKHIDVGAELTKTEWESEESHEVVHGTSFSSSPVERQLFYRDDEHKWYVYNGSAWVWLGGGGVSTFLQLTDTPSSYSGQGGKVAKVKSSEDGLEFGQVTGMQEHGNEYHDPDFAEVSHTHSDLSPAHKDQATGVHGVGGSTVESASGSQAKVDAHKGLTTGVHGVGAGTIAKVADIAVDSNLSSAAQDAISKRHTQNTDTKIRDTDNDTQVDVEQSADEDQVRMKVAGTEAFLLYNNGVLTLNKQSGFRAYRTAAQSIPSTAWTKVQYNTEEYDIQGEYDHVTNFRFTAAKAGKYLVTAICGLDSLSDGKAVTLVVVRNGDMTTWVGARRLVTATTGAAGGLCFSGSGTMNLAANDYIEIYIYHTDTAAKNTPAEAMSVSWEVIKVA
jgi:hypothetical protein